MEALALILFYIFLIGIIASIACMVISCIKKNFKFSKKQILVSLLICFVGFIASTVLFSKVQSPESKAKYEANQKSKEEEKAKKELELAEKEKKAEEENQKQIEQEDKTKEKEKTEIETKEDVPEKTEVKEESDKVDDRFTITSEPNTTAAVDEIINKGKEDALKASEEEIKEAIKFINDNYDNYWTNNETMHRGMYYGSLLEYSKKDKAKENQKGLDYTIYNLGTDTVQAIKYVYRKAETVEDSSTQSNLKQVKKSLDNIPDEYKK